MNYMWALVCVLGISIGQLLFKLAADSWVSEQNLFGVRTLSILAGACLLYGGTTILWVWVLKQSELSRIYPMMSLAFILVPIGSALFLGERFGPMYYVGVGMIATGLILALTAGR